MTALTKEGLPRRRVSPGASIEDRIFLHTDRSGECWIWTGAVDKRSGYGRITIDGKSGYYAHRVSYEGHVGPIPNGLHLDHLCRNRACCNPEHLEPVTCLENVQRGHHPNVLATGCPLGHPYTFDNTYLWRDKRPQRTAHRTCRTCRRAYGRIYNSMTPEERAGRKRAGLPVVDLAAYFAEQAAA